MSTKPFQRQLLVALARESPAFGGPKYKQYFIRSSASGSGRNPVIESHGNRTIPHYRLIYGLLAVVLAVSTFVLNLYTPTKKSDDVSTVYTENVIRLLGHSGRVNSVAFSPDGNLLATASADSTVKLWDPNGDQVATFVADAPVHAVALTDDLLAAAEQDGTVRLWNSDVGSEAWVFTSHGDTVNSVAFSPDGRLLAAASADKTVNVWDTDRHDNIARVQYSDTVNSVAFSPDGRLLAAAIGDRTVTFSVPDVNVEFSEFTGHGDTVESVAFSPDGRLLATASADKTVKVWDTDRQVEIATFTHADTVESVAFSPDGRLLATASTDGTRLWRVPVREPAASEGSAEIGPEHVLVETEGSAATTSTAFNLRTGDLAAASADGTTRIYTSR